MNSIEESEDLTLKTLGTIVWYNGWYDILQKIKIYLQNELKQHNNEPTYYGFDKPDFLKDFDADLFPSIIWSILVLQCGDYGTSPRTGWVEKGKVHYAIEIIDSLCAETEEYNNYI